MNYDVPKGSEKKSILIVQGHPIVRERLTAVINGTPDLVVCGEAQTAIASNQQTNWPPRCSRP